MIDMDLNDDTEKKVVEGVFWNAVDILSEEDRRLPHIHAILPMLKRGVGVHHSGLLPILKEVIEILFQEGLIKVIKALFLLVRLCLSGSFCQALFVPNRLVQPCTRDA